MRIINGQINPAGIGIQSTEYIERFIDSLRNAEVTDNNGNLVELKNAST